MSAATARFNDEWFDRMLRSNVYRGSSVETQPIVTKLAEVEILRNELSGANRRAEQLLIERDLARAEAVKLRGALGAVEWIAALGGMRRCPWCYQAEEIGHAQSCWRQRALDIPAERSTAA